MSSEKCGDKQKEGIPKIYTAIILKLVKVMFSPILFFFFFKYGINYIPTPPSLELQHRT